MFYLARDISMSHFKSVRINVLLEQPPLCWEAVKDANATHPRQTSLTEKKKTPIQNKIQYKTFTEKLYSKT